MLDPAESELLFNRGHPKGEPAYRFRAIGVTIAVRVLGDYSNGRLPGHSQHSHNRSFRRRLSASSEVTT